MKKINGLFFLTLFAVAVILCGCGERTAIPDDHKNIEGLEFSERVSLEYAECFAIDRYNDGYSVIYTAEGVSYLVVPEGGKIPENIDDNMKVIQTPVSNIYLAATSSMGLFDSLGCGSVIGFSGTKADDWYIDFAKNAMESGDIVYAGKYREPDYEMLLSSGCKFSVQSTMIEHSPDVKEKLEELGITVFVDYSSYESHPLGRSEWIKVYGEILGRSDKAESLFKEQSLKLENIDTGESTGKTAVFFYINSAGQAVTRKSGDYVTKMIELGGGENVFHDLGNGSGMSTVTMEMEEFYSKAKDADFIIYNSTIDGELSDVEELVSKNKLLEDFKAVKEDNVWCTKDNLFQETMKLGSVISDFNLIFTGEWTENSPQFLYKLEGGGENG